MSNLDEPDRNWLRKILLTPIKLEGSKVLEIDDKNNVILSSGNRYNTVDPDMSDLAIAFYKILYGKEMLKSDGKFCCHEFAGDTMNSFKSVANQFFDGSTKRCAKRKKVEESGELPTWLQEYFEGYHCLANFWAIPEEIGRRSKKGDRYDFAFCYIEENLNNPDDPRFLDRHCVRCYTKIEEDDSNPQKCVERVIEKPDYNNPYKCAERVKELWKARADEIINSSKAEQLFKCFKDLSSGQSTCQ